MFRKQKGLLKTLGNSKHNISDFRTFVHKIRTNKNTYNENKDGRGKMEQKGVNVDFIAFEPDSTLIMIIENQTQADPYVFEFLNKYEVK